MQKNRGIFADGVKHHWFMEGGSRLPENLNGFVFKRI
jgi:hypothetical protein